MIALTSGVAIRIGDCSPTGCRTRGVEKSTSSGVQFSSVRLGKRRYSPKEREISGRIRTAALHNSR